MPLQAWQTGTRIALLENTQLTQQSVPACTALPAHRIMQGPLQVRPKKPSQTPNIIQQAMHRLTVAGTSAEPLPTPAGHAVCVQSTLQAA